MSFNSREFRNCLGAFATGVTVITTHDAAQSPCGITVNSFSSVSLSPPLILFSVGKDAYYYEAFTKAAYFGVNILSEKQRNLSVSFARSLEQPWDEVSYQLAAHGSPKFNDNHSFMECERYAVYDGGDHSIILGKVLAIESENEGFPLLYYRGEYHTIGHAQNGDNT